MISFLSSFWLFLFYSQYLGLFEVYYAIDKLSEREYNKKLHDKKPLGVNLKEDVQ